MLHFVCYIACCEFGMHQVRILVIWQLPYCYGKLNIWSLSDKAKPRFYSNALNNSLWNNVIFQSTVSENLYTTKMYKDNVFTCWKMCMVFQYFFLTHNQLSPNCHRFVISCMFTLFTHKINTVLWLYKSPGEIWSSTGFSSCTS